MQIYLSVSKLVLLQWLSLACVGAQGLRSTILWEWLVARAQAARCDHVPGLAATAKMSCSVTQRVRLVVVFMTLSIDAELSSASDRHHLP